MQRAQGELNDAACGAKLQLFGSDLPKLYAAVVSALLQCLRKALPATLLRPLAFGKARSPSCCQCVCVPIVFSENFTNPKSLPMTDGQEESGVAQRPPLPHARVYFGPFFSPGLCEVLGGAVAPWGVICV